VPRHEYRGKLAEVPVYEMNNIGGTCMYLALGEPQSNNFYLLWFTIDDYARLVNSSFPGYKKKSN
jgi:hypothetical protein